MESSIAVFLSRQPACERLPTTCGVKASLHDQVAQHVFASDPLGHLAPRAGEETLPRNHARTAARQRQPQGAQRSPNLTCPAARRSASRAYEPTGRPGVRRAPLLPSGMSDAKQHDTPIQHSLRLQGRSAGVG